MTSFTVRSTCRSCSGDALEPILSLGLTPLANALLSTPEDQDDRVPLDLVFCPECTLVQITEDVPPEILFRDYVYFSSFSDTVLSNARSIALRLAEQRHLDEHSLILEVASNDGYLLQHYKELGIPVLGVEPARNIAEVARSRGIDTIEEFFTHDLARTMAGRADVIHGNNVMAHVSDLNDFVAGVATALKDGGVTSIEVPYVRDLIDHLEFDTIYHEHLCYFSVTAVDSLFARHGLTLGEVERLPIHGGSLRLFAGRGMARGDSVRALLEEERQWGVALPSAYQQFGDRVRGLCDKLRSVLSGVKKDGHRIAAYGASAKGTTLLSFSGIGAETVDFVVDRSTVKQGKLTPGTHLPILPPEELLERMPDYVLLLSWNFADEVMRQQTEYRERGGRFIVPLPEVRII